MSHLPSLQAVLLSSVASAGLAVLALSLVSGPLELTRTESVPTAAKPAIRTYQVRRGDTLSLIAARELGSTERWRDLFAANRDRLRSPSDIEVGTTLRLPGGER